MVCIPSIFFFNFFSTGTCSGNSEVADVKVFNELNQGIQNLIFKGAQVSMIISHFYFFNLVGPRDWLDKFMESTMPVL